MSMNLTAMIWDSDLPFNEKIIALAYADQADPDHNNTSPSLGWIAWRTGYSEMSVKRITKSLVKNGVLIYRGNSQERTNAYKINVNKINVRTWTEPKCGRPRKIS